jgi:NAD(P)-dependent dehydrogenase (short-subunit alcohol dehydrogenase family)
MARPPPHWCLSQHSRVGASRCHLRPRLRLGNLLYTNSTGAEISKQLAAKGCKVAVNYAFSEDRAKGTLDSLAGSGHVLIQGDAFDRASIKRIADEAIEKLGGVDIVISNAGWTTFAPFDDLRESC